MSRSAVKLFLTVIMGLNSCKPNITLPKPHAYPRVVYPSGSLREVNETYCPLKFEFPTYGEIEKETSFFDEQPADPCWFTIQIHSLNASIHCSYGNIDKMKPFDNYIEDAYKLLSKHNIKAEFREEIPLHPRQDVTGMAFEIDGPVATPYQFYLTDSLHHFFRAALYFNAKVNPDSTKPVLAFLKKDIQRMENTFEWKSR
ncbi:MAG: hypothetical protein ABI844_15120 [Saprospiraceae bacterium]